MSKKTIKFYDKDAADHKFGEGGGYTPIEINLTQSNFDVINLENYKFQLIFVQSTELIIKDLTLTIPDWNLVMRPSYFTYSEEIYATFSCDEEISKELLISGGAKLIIY